MTPMRIIILAVAAGAALLAGYMVFNLSQAPAPAPVQTVQAEPEKIQIPEVNVLVASRDLEIGTLITPDDLSWASWPEAALNDHYIVDEAAPEAMDEATGWVVRSKFFENEPVIRPKVVVKGETGYMAALLKDGARAVSIQISAESASSGFILPNDRVDGILTYGVEYIDPVTGADATRTETRTVLQNVRVLSIDQNFAYDPETGQQSILGSTALLEVSPRQAELVAHAQQLGEIRLALRSVADALVSGDVVRSYDELLDFGAGVEAPEAVPIFKGGLRQNQSAGTRGRS